MHHTLRNKNHLKRTKSRRHLTWCE